MIAFNRVLLAALLLGMLIGSGCSSQPKDPFTESDAASKYHNFVPPTAMTVASGTGTLTYTTTEPGTLYLVDMDVKEKVPDTQFEKPKVLATGLLLKGMEITFDPSQRWIHAKGREGVKIKDVDPNHLHELRFEPTAKP
jgi:hypothetical protein